MREIESKKVMGVMEQVEFQQNDGSSCTTPNGKRRKKRRVNLVQHLKVNFST